MAGARAHSAELIAFEGALCVSLTDEPMTLTGNGRAAADAIVKSIGPASERQLLLQALIRLACSEDNAQRATFETVAGIVSTGGGILPSEERIRQFSLGNPIDRRDRHAMIDACLRAVCILKIKSHPCSHYLPFRAIFASTEWLKAYQRLLAGADPAIVMRGNAIDLARNLFRWVADAEAVHTPEVERLLQSTLFNESVPTYATSVRLHMQQGQISLGELKFTHLPAPEGGLPFIHVCTRAMDAQAVDPDAVLSDGFVVPRRMGVYVFQQQRGGYGFNITALQNREVEQGQRPFLRAVLITLDRDENHVPIIAKSAYLVGERDLRGYMPVAEFRAEMARRNKSAAGEDVLRYLSSTKDAAVAFPVPGRGTVRARSWDQLRQCLETVELDDSFDAPTIELMRPITGT